VPGQVARFEDGFVAVSVFELEVGRFLLLALALVAFLAPGPLKIELPAYSTSRPTSKAAKEISPPCAVTVCVEGPERSR
jgi:hypothetical protein